MPGIVEECPRGALLDELARVEHADAVAHLGNHAEVVRDEEDARPELLPEVRDELEHLGLDGGVEPGGGLVQDEKRRVRGEGHGDDDTLLHAARKLMRVPLHDRTRIRDLDLAQHRLGPLRRLLALAPKHLEHLGDLTSNADRRIQSAARVLIDHRDRARPDLTELGPGDGEQVAAVDTHAAVQDPAVPRQVADDREGSRRLPTGRLADQAIALALGDREGHLEAPGGHVL